MSVRKVAWFGTKLGIVGGAFYYTNEAGLWGDSRQSEQLYKDLYNLAAPYMRQAPVEVPDLPRVADMTRGLAASWNCGVIATTGFLFNLPTHVSEWTTTAYSKIQELVSDPSPPSS